MRITSGGDITVSGGDLFLNSGTNYNDKGVIYLSNERTAIISDIVNGTANGDTSLDFQTRKNGTRASAMFINEYRNVMIGTQTQAPSAQLTIALNDSVGGRLSLSNLRTALFDGDEFGRLSFVSNDTTQTGDRARISAICRDTGAATDLAFYTGNTSASVAERMRITSLGDVLFGTQGLPNGTSIYGSAFHKSTVDRMILRMASSTTVAAGLIDFFNPNGQVGYIATNGTATQYVTSSDYRLKEDLQDFNGLDKVSKIPVYDFKWKTDENRSYGVMAHELQEVLPDAVSGDKDAEEMQGVDYSKIVPLLVKSIQELKAEVDKLKQECKCKN